MYVHVNEYSVIVQANMQTMMKRHIYSLFFTLKLIKIEIV